MSGLEGRGLAVSSLDHLSCPECILNSTLLSHKGGLFHPEPSLVLAKEETEDDPTQSLGAVHSVSMTEKDQITGRMQSPSSMGKWKKWNTTQQLKGMDYCYMDESYTHNNESHLLYLHITLSERNQTQKNILIPFT